MTTPDGPPPAATGTELWLKAVHDQLARQSDLLRELIDRQPPQSVTFTTTPAGGDQLITEPAPPRAGKKAAPAKGRQPSREDVSQ